jgi:hypothetical protein
MSNVPFCRNPYNYDVDEASLASGLVCPEPSLAQQHQADEADINTIVKRFGVSGMLPQAARAPTYDDFSEVVDFHTAQLAIRRAQESFMTLPAAIRSRFGNDPGAFVDFCSEESNREELRSMGLVVSGAPSEAPVAPSDPQAGSA